MKNKEKRDDLVQVAIIGGDYRAIDILSKYIYDIICPKNIDMIQILYSDENNLGYIWARENGMPVRKISAATPQKLINRLIYFEAEYIFFLLNDEQWIKNLIMQYKMTGKHGSVIKIPYRAAAFSFTKTTPSAAHFPLPNFIWEPNEEDYYKEVFQWQLNKRQMIDT